MVRVTVSQGELTEEALEAFIHDRFMERWLSIWETDSIEVERGEINWDGAIDAVTPEEIRTWKISPVYGAALWSL